MRYLKAKNISKWSVNDQTLISYPSQFNPAGKGNRVVMNATGGLMLPKGTTDQRPLLSGVRQPTDANGTIRYNTTTRTLEAYIDDVWEVVKAPGSLAISTQTLGPGDGDETLFGPLTEVPPNTSYQASALNIIVLVENVFQIAPTNFDVVQNPPGKAEGWYLEFTSAVPAAGLGGDPVFITVFYGYAD